MAQDSFDDCYNLLQRGPYLQYLAFGEAITRAILPRYPRVDGSGRRLTQDALTIVRETVLSDDFQSMRSAAYRQTIAMNQYLVPAMGEYESAPVSAARGLVAELAGVAPLYQSIGGVLSATYTPPTDPEHAVPILDRVQSAYRSIRQASGSLTQSELEAIFHALAD